MEVYKFILIFGKSKTMLWERLWLDCEVVKYWKKDKLSF